jgi:hypothetical protein
MNSRADKPNEAAEGGKSSAKRTPLEDLDVEMEIEYTTPGTPLDDRLRREQAAAVLALLADSERRTKSDSG